MKKFRKAVSVFLTLSVLLATTGFSYTTHQCLSEKKNGYAKPDVCCRNDCRGNPQPSKCCTVKSIYIKAKIVSTHESHNQKLSPDNPFGNTFDATNIWGPVMGRKIYLGLRYIMY